MEGEREGGTESLCECDRDADINAFMDVLFDSCLSRFPPPQVCFLFSVLLPCFGCEQPKTLP